VGDLLWAPWRMEFIAGPREEGCFICHAARSDGGDAERLVLFRGRRALVMMNRFPYANGHLMVAPVRHGETLADLSGEEAAEILGLAGRCTTILGSAFGAAGFNLGFNLGKVAGAGVVDHLHLHVVPRWLGDTNFLPVIGETRVMPEYLATTFRKLAPHFRGAGD
jgi:ATP adenylyltransferase